jgi:PhnB protein
MSITPHIVVQGAERAVAIYRHAFEAEELSRIPVPDGRLMSVQLRIGDGLLHLADEFPEMGVLAPPSIGGTPVVLALDVADAEAVFAQAVAAGAQIRQPLADMFWGDRHGQLEDLFGHRWIIAQHLRDAPHDEVVAAATGIHLSALPTAEAPAGLRASELSWGNDLARLRHADARRTVFVSLRHASRTTVNAMQQAGLKNGTGGTDESLKVGQA